MDAFFKETNEILETVSDEAGKNIEPLHKKLIARSYNCMSNCFLINET